jgi:Domain of Unknown Function (DUF928)
MKLTQTLFGSIGAISIVLMLVASAFAGYIPLDNVHPIDDSTIRSPGSRRGSCPDLINADDPFRILAPRNPIGTASSTRPTFAWLTPEGVQVNETRVRFKLFRYEGDSVESRRKIMEKDIPVARTGMTSWTFPNDEAALTTGIYYWQVTLLCNPDSSSDNPFDRVEFQVKQPSPELVSRIRTTSDTDTKANLYYEAGFWYDAFALASQELRQSFLGDLKQYEDRATANPQ